MRMYEYRTKQTPELFHVQTNTSIELPQTNTVILIGKADYQSSPDIDISKFPNSGIVSRIHAGISQKENIYFIEDLKSSSGYIFE